MPSAYFQWTGLAELTRTLRGLPAEVAQNVLEETVDAAAQPIVLAAKIYAGRSRRTGALQASLTSVVRNYPRRGISVAVIGPDKRYYRKGRVVRGKKALGADRPANYAHLVEFGHIVVKPVSGTSRRRKTAVSAGIVAAKPFLRPAFSSQQDIALERMAITMTAGVNRALAKLVVLQRKV